MNWQAILGWLSTYGTPIGTVLSLLGIWLGWIQIRMVRKQQLAEQVLAALDVVCTTPTPYIATYEDVYSKLFSYYAINPEVIHDSDIIITNKNYIVKCVAKFSPRNPQLDKPDLQYIFPVVTKRNLLLSSNPSLNIQMSAFNIVGVTKISATQKESKIFLNYFSINDFATFLSSRGRKLWNAATFELVSLVESRDTVELSFILGSYNNYINNNELLLKELYFQEYTAQRKDFKSFEIRRLVPPKFLVRNGVSLDTLFEFSGRPTSVGFSTFVIMNKGNGRYCTFIQKRDSDQVEYPGFFHVAPAGTFQPLSEFDTETIEKQCNFAFTILRELLEEVFNLEEADKNKSIDPFEIFRLEIAVNSTDKFCPGKILGVDREIELENKQYKIIPTSFAIDLMTLKPHISSVLVVTAPDLYYSAHTMLKGNWEGNIKEFDIESEEFVRFVERNLNINGFPPVGAITLAEGIKYFTTYINHNKNLK